MARKLQNFEDKDLDLPRQRSGGQADWMMSYADITTALMCFFLIFFATSNIQKEESILDSLIVALESEKGKQEGGAGSSDKDGHGGSGSQGGTQNGTTTGAGGAGNNSKVDSDTPEKDLFSYLQNREGFKVSKYGRSIIVDFKDGSFFKSASRRLTENGTQKIIAFSNLLKGFKDKIFIEIQGHSDTTPVSWKPNRNFSNNTELSILRANEVFKKLIRKGYNPGNLAVSGFGSAYSIRKKGGDVSKAKSRRVSFRITERGVNEND